MESSEISEKVEPAEAIKQPRKLSRLRKGPKIAGDNITPAQAPCENVQPNLKDTEFEEGDDQPATNHDAPSSNNAACDNAAQPSTGKDASYYDEEDELEDYFGKRAADGEASATEDENEAGDASLSGSPGRNGSRGASGLLGGGSSDSEDDGDWKPRGQTDEHPEEGAEDLAAETQRILRETAARDRLGRGRSIEVRPLSSILDKLKQRQALAIARAPKPVLQGAGVFEDILAEATTKAVPAAASGAGAAAAPLSAANSGASGDGGEGCTADAAQAPGTDAAGAADSDLDLEILSSDNEEAADADVRLVELPSTIKKQRFASFPSQEVEFEDEVLIDDGYHSTEDEEQEEAEEQRRGQTPSPLASHKASEDTAGSEDEDEEEEEEEEKQGTSGPSKAEQAAEDGGDSQPTAGRDADTVDPQVPSSAERSASLDAANGALPDPAAVAEKMARKERRAQRMLLDVEAELSDEEAGASEDEDEEDLDDKGELAGLIDSQAQLTRKDRALGEMLHREWAERQDREELQQVLAGLKNGFRRRRGAGFMDDEDEEAAARRRRARLEDDEDLPAGGGGLLLPGLGGGEGSDGEGEEQEMLRKANTRHLLADSQGMEGDDDFGSVPLDEGSQEVLGLLARSTSEPQVPAASAAAAGLSRSRFAPQAALGLLGSDPTNSRGHGALSFLGRQPTATRAHASGALGSSRSFVFGRGDDSNSALPEQQQGQVHAGTGVKEASSGPTSFANLRQMAGLPPSGPHAKPRHLKRGSSLVSKLLAPPQLPGREGSQLAADAVAAVCEQVVLRGGGRGR